ncbi:MAG: heme ABC transporter ATP-binding protein, partial [Myxococcota bacterium]
LLDEPTSALDLAWQHRLLDRVRRFAAQGNAVLIVLHDLGLAAVHADRTALLHDGCLVGIGAPRNVLTPRSLARAYGVEAHWVDVPNVGAMPVVLGARKPTSSHTLEVQ